MPQGGISRWKWDFGDGYNKEGLGSPPSCVTDPYSAWAKHTYTAIAHRTAKLEVLDAYSNYDSEEMDVYVVDISLSAGSTYICRDLVPIYLSVETVKMNDKARLMILDEPGAIRIWEHANKSGLILGDGTDTRDWNTSYFTTPRTWYVEGVADSEQYPRLDFWYVGWDGYAPYYPPGTQCEINFTVGNPITVTSYINFIKFGFKWEFFPVEIIEGYYDRSIVCWDSCYTSKGRKFNHLHAENDFPFDVGDLDGNGATDYAYAYESDQYWDTQYLGYERTSSATFSQNCHGHAQGKSYWIDENPRVIEDDYVQTTSTDGEFEYSPDHSIKVLSFYPSGNLCTTSEKMHHSGVYTRTFLPPGAIPNTMYKKR